MTEPYISPIPVRVDSLGNRRHAFQGPAGETLCQPKSCRECTREKDSRPAKVSAVKAKPINFAIDDAREAFHRGNRQMVRPATVSTRSWERGEKLWVREMFYLPDKFEGFASPLQAMAHGAKDPLFAADIRKVPDGWGSRRAARMLPRLWHRFHIVIGDIALVNIQDIAAREARDLGFQDIAAYAESWDAKFFNKRNISGDRCDFDFNPAVFDITFDVIKEPL